VGNGEETTEAVPRLQKASGVARRRRERPGAVLQEMLSQKGMAGEAVAWAKGR
jgi:hypothetical protein